jgi:hypothetical protein
MAGKEESMEKKAILETCNRILDVFDSLSHDVVCLGSNARERSAMASYWMSVTDFDAKWEKMVKTGNDKSEEEAFASWASSHALAFAFGYSIGRMFDTPYPQIEKDVKAVQRVIREKCFLPYVPREKKA